MNFSVIFFWQAIVDVERRDGDIGGVSVEREFSSPWLRDPGGNGRSAEMRSRSPSASPLRMVGPAGLSALNFHLSGIAVP